MNVAHCPTEQMWAEILTKPLQGAKFCQMRAHLINCPVEYFEHSMVEYSTTTMQTLMENQPPDLPLQGCVRTSTNIHHKPCGNQKEKKQMAARELCMSWKTPVTDIIN